MPLYEYSCEDHGHVVAVVMGMGEGDAEVPIPAEEIEAAPVECVHKGCMYRRKFSVFNGRFGDTPNYHT